MHCGKLTGESKPEPDQIRGRFRFCYLCGPLGHEPGWFVQEGNFTALLIALLIFLVGVPIADDLQLLYTPSGRALIFSSLLAIGVWSLKGQVRFFRIGMTFAVGGILLNVLAAVVGSGLFHYGSFLALFGFLVTAIACVFRQIALTHEISFNRLTGAICVYLMLGILWATVYTTLTWISPNAINGLPPLDGHRFDSDAIYFSFVTLTTLGYGDIAPATATARSIAYMQAVVGQFYLAILVAGLVGAFIADRQSKG